MLDKAKDFVGKNWKKIILGVLVGGGTITIGHFLLNRDDDDDYVYEIEEASETTETTEES